MLVDAVHFGNVAVGDGAIGGSEEQDDGLVAGKFGLGMHCAFGVAELERERRGQRGGGAKAEIGGKSHLPI